MPGVTRPVGHALLRSNVHDRLGGCVMKRTRRTALVGMALAAVCAAAAPGQAMAASETCTAPTTTAVDGYIFNNYFKLTSQRNPDDPKTTWVCYRAYDHHRGDTNIGGRLNVTEPTVSPTLPSVDSRSADCSTTPGNTLPGNHPMLSGGLFGGSRYLIDAYAGGSDVWACLLAGPVSTRLKVSTAGIAVP